MRRLGVAAAAALLLVSSWPATVVADPSVQRRMWVSRAESATITTCLTGNSAVIDGAQPTLLGTKITGRVTFCLDEDARYFGLEFFSGGPFPVAGYFLIGMSVGSGGLTVDFSFTGVGFDGVTATCVSAAPNDRLACARLSIDGKTGAVNLTPIAVADPSVAAASGPMLFCDPDDKHLDPTCVTCV